MTFKNPYYHAQSCIIIGMVNRKMNHECVLWHIVLVKEQVNNIMLDMNYSTLKPTQCFLSCPNKIYVRTRNFLLKWRISKIGDHLVPSRIEVCPITYQKRVKTLIKTYYYVHLVLQIKFYLWFHIINSVTMVLYLNFGWKDSFIIIFDNILLIIAFI